MSYWGVTHPLITMELTEEATRPAARHGSGEATETTWAVSAQILSHRPAFRLAIQFIRLMGHFELAMLSRRSEAR
jgi:hypothetical protein